MIAVATVIVMGLPECVQCQDILDPATLVTEVSREVQDQFLTGLDSSCACTCCHAEPNTPSQVSVTGEAWKCVPKMRGAQTQCEDPCQATTHLQATTGVTSGAVAIYQYCANECMFHSQNVTAPTTDSVSEVDSESRACAPLDSHTIERRTSDEEEEHTMMKVVPLHMDGAGAGTDGALTSREEAEEQAVQGMSTMTPEQRWNQIIRAAEAAAAQTQQILDLAASDDENSANLAEGAAIAARSSVENFDPSTVASKLEKAAAGPAAAAGLLQVHGALPKESSIFRPHTFLHPTSL